MPRQNEIDIALTPAQLTQLDEALTGLETLAGAFPVLSADEKAALVKAPEGADGWMAGMLTRANQNLGRLPRDFDPAAVQKDLDLDAMLAPRQLRLARVLDRLECARFLARSDAFAELLGARRILRDSGVAGVDDNLSEGLQRFFSRSNKGLAPAPIPAAGGT